MIDSKTVKHVALLSRLHLEESDVERIAGQLSAITNYIDELTQIPLDNLTLHRDLDQANAWREDEARPSQRPEQLLSNAPDQEAGYLKIRKVVE